MTGEGGYHHSGYCLCTVIGLSGNGTQTFLLCLFSSRSRSCRMRVASSFSTTEMPRLNVSIRTDKGYSACLSEE